MSEISEQKQSEKAQRANRIFEEHIRPSLSEETPLRAYVAIDLESHDFAVHENQLIAADRLLERHPEAKGRIWFRRVGSPVTHRIGGRLPRDNGEL